MVERWVGLKVGLKVGNLVALKAAQRVGHSDERKAAYWAQRMVGLWVRLKDEN